jgi:hypothetical protein
MKGFGIGGFIMNIGAMISLVVFFSSYRSTKQFLKCAVTTQGIVSSLDIKESTSSSGNSKHVGHTMIDTFPVIEFKAQNGETVSFESNTI